MKLDLGSGYIKRKGYLSVDIDSNVDPDIVADIRYLDPIKSSSADEIFTSHTLEHVSNTDLFKTLRTFHRVLKPTGKLTIIVPDVHRAAIDWSKDKIDYRKFDSVVMGGNPDATPFQLHRNIFSDVKLIRYLLITGFTNIDVIYDDKNYELVSTAYKPKRNGNAKFKATRRNR